MKFKHPQPRQVSAIETLAHTEKIKLSRHRAQPEPPRESDSRASFAPSVIRNVQGRPEQVLRQSALFSAEAMEVEEDDELSADGSCLALRSDLVMRVFTWADDSNSDTVNTEGRDSDSAVRINALIKRLKRSGSMRPRRGPARGWNAALDQLSQDFPNFASVIEAVIRPHLALMDKGYAHRMNSVLMVGPPGIGKTYFTQQLARIMDVGRPLFVGMAAETNGSSLAGSSVFWSNSSPGRLFERLAWGQGGVDAVANPLVILDEIDKTSADRFDPLGPLYSLLEAETARSFQDQSVLDVFVDASQVRFIATANDISSLPQPLRSRMFVFEIAPPSEEQQRRVVQRMFESAIQSLGVDLNPQLPAGVMDSAVRLSAREVKVRLDCAIARAVSSDRDHLMPGDWLEVDQSDRRRRNIGFTN